MEEEKLQIILYFKAYNNYESAPTPFLNQQVAGSHMPLYMWPNQILKRVHLYGHAYVIPMDFPSGSRWLESYEILKSYKPRASIFPSVLDYTDCPYTWPFCRQPLYAGAMLVIFISSSHL
ncbi:hypothetical protein JHK85_004583 [Glycine max]|nr:hypothetical protein JHK87_004241 [Glycine soja]KAG5063400.1 hypothetical protein JHK85_004583 [Glycine max]KAG5080342.1 hypothetical protein JHK86_004407 [Glycine max]